MAGRVNAHLVVHRNAQSWTIEPDVCPVADEHRKNAANTDPLLAPHCQDFDVGFGRRTCPYWYATTRNGNAANRVDGSVLWEEASQDGHATIRCGVLCMGARRNRAPGI